MVVKLASVAVICEGHTSPSNTTNQIFHRNGRSSNTTCSCPHYLLCLRYLEPTGLHESTREESIHDLDSSCVIMGCGNQGTKRYGKLVTFEPV